MDNKQPKTIAEAHSDGLTTSDPREIFEFLSYFSPSQESGLAASWTVVRGDDGKLTVTYRGDAPAESK